MMPVPMRGRGSRFKLQGPEYISCALSFSWSALAGGPKKLFHQSHIHSQQPCLMLPAI